MRVNVPPVGERIVFVSGLNRAKADGTGAGDAARAVTVSSPTKTSVDYHISRHVASLAVNLALMDVCQTTSGGRMVPTHGNRRSHPCPTISG